MPNHISIYTVETSPIASQIQLANHDIHIWQTQLDRTAAALAQLHLLLSEDEQVRAARFYFERDRNRYIATRALLRQLLGGYLAMPPEPIRFTYSRQGKPQLDLETTSAAFHGSRPVRQTTLDGSVAANSSDGCLEELFSPLYFNLAHSADQAIFAFAHRPVGIDIEAVRTDIDCDLLAPGIFSVQELSEWQSLSSSAKRPTFFSLWSRKEALVKAIGQGLGYPLQELTVGFSQVTNATIKFVAPITTGTDHWLLYDIPVASGYCGALAVLG